jgi:hypothetical protein
MQSGKAGVMGGKYLGKLDMVQKDLALQAKLWDIILQVGRGCNASNFATDNASAGVAARSFAPEKGESFAYRSPNYGGIEGETFLRKNNPFSNLKAQNWLGPTAQSNIVTGTKIWCGGPA